MQILNITDVRVWPILLKNSVGNKIYPVSWDLLSLPDDEKSIVGDLVRLPFWAETG
jgi:hypothetical protein